MDSQVSLYVHWPFCLSKCPYCDFNSHVAKSFDYDLWQKLYERELCHFASYIKGKKIRSIFFGGGTPSLMSAGLVGSVLNSCASLGRIDSDTEISLEANPTSFEAQKFKDFASCGVNRLSIGMQALRDSRLKHLGRKHSAKEALLAFESGAKIFSNISADFIYATQEQDLSSWALELKEILALKAQHLSLYQLSIEENTPFYSRMLAGKLRPLEQDLASELYEYTNSAAASAGYNRYEISNYAASSARECRHNLNYWNYSTYIGIGPGAHSRIIENSEVWAIETHLSPKVWSDSVLEKGHGISKRTLLTSHEVATELLLMGLRTTYGVDLARLQKVVEVKKMLDALKSLEKEGLAQRREDQLMLTSKGMALHTEVVYALLNGIY